MFCCRRCGLECAFPPEFLQHGRLFAVGPVRVCNLAEDAAHDAHVVGGVEFPEGICLVIMGVNAVLPVFLDDDISEAFGKYTDDDDTGFDIKYY